MPGAFLCELHIGEKRRCSGVVHTYDEATGEVTDERRCKRSAMAGLDVCLNHGGNGTLSKAVSARTPALTAMQRLVEPYEGALDPVTAFESEFRRTYGRILWLEGQLGALNDERDLIWGLSQEDTIMAAEFPGTNLKYTARIHMFEEMLRWERKHFLDLEKVWIRANLDEKKLSIMRDHINYTYTKVLEAATLLGFDSNDQVTRERLMGLFTGDGQPLALES